ncbi:cytochrome ubiquinol oxidase subunit I [Propioniciclava coleopterorum]|uniref:Cytochrome ubiquinol oxidase subunit I n=1 Tax=Propioniciclava coleopterorum TaxID=2714937 RepID=A0A6G7Y7B0_9ACTN|nr:cytochrome ubiquinol oxidase subunit I [Propioniciclava coleopterorum]QIK72566.1 cytochrome ubiquinol oxidase subunit I [Propioniciclava coleopterorum]
MSPETIARWQFGITTVYHYFFVPVTIAMSLLVAVMQTMWVRTGADKYLRLTKFFGKLFLINFAMGVVTGIVQEFQFGMNWSEYSRFVGDIFGAPLALEALLAFFLESTFLGLWIFGWDRLPKKLHLAAIWLASAGATVSAVFILAANSFMQNPVGATYNPFTDRAEMTDFGALLTNPVFLATFPHTLSAAYMTGSGLVLAISGWHLAKLNKADRTAQEDADVSAFRWSTKFAAWVLLASGAAVILSGDFQGKVMYQVQPMKMAAAEALYETAGGDGEMAPFSLLTIGSLDGSRPIFEIHVPGVLGILAKNDPYARIEGINNLQESYRQGALVNPNNALQQAYSDKLATIGISDFTPNIPVTYWTFRIMMTLGFIAIAIGAWTLFTLRKDRLPKHSVLWSFLMLAVVLGPLFGNSAGWIFTEMGRQPWIVAGVLPTASAVSPGVGVGSVFATMVLYTLIYGALAVVEVGLMIRYAKAGLPAEVAPVEIKGEDDVLSFAY